MAGRATDPFAGGKVSMDEATFKAAREMLEKPPAHPSLVATHERIYYAAMILDHRQRAIEAAAVGNPVPTHFVCPICRANMQENFRLQTYECPPCQRGITPSAIINMFHINPVPFQTQQTGKKAASNIFVPNYTPPKVDPKDYKPKLTTPLPKGLTVDELADKVHENRTEQDEPVIMWRSWKLLAEPVSAPETVFLNEDTHAEPGLRYLQSINSVCWPHKKPIEATHHNDPEKHKDRPAPDWHCHCGIYAVKTLIQAQKWGAVSFENPHSPLQVLGKVVLWGRVLVFETGAKSQFAYPKVVYISPTQAINRGQNPERMASELSAQYGIEVEVDDGMFDMKLSHA